MATRHTAAGLVLALLTPALGECQPEAALVVRRGTLQQRVLLTGELVEARGEQIIVPATPTWQLTVRWLAADGQWVRAGERVLELDGSRLAATLEERRQAVAEARTALERTRAEAVIEDNQRSAAVETARIAVERARLRAALPREVLPLAEWEERQLALKRALASLATAEEQLATSRAAARADEEIQRRTLAKAERALAAAEQALAALTLRAPRDGLVIIAEHPREGRKIMVGDMVWTDVVVARLPDLASLQVSAQLADVDEGAVAIGMPARCTLDAYPGRVFTGVVQEITRVARQLTRTTTRRAFNVTVALDSPDPEVMRPGMSVKVEIDPPPRTGVLLAPRAGLRFSNGAAYALLEDGGEVEVRVEACSTQECEISAGLAEGAVLVARQRGRR